MSVNHCAMWAGNLISIAMPHFDEQIDTLSFTHLANFSDSKITNRCKLQEIAFLFLLHFNQLQTMEPIQRQSLAIGIGR